MAPFYRLGARVLVPLDQPPLQIPRTLWLMYQATQVQPVSRAIYLLAPVLYVRIEGTPQACVTYITSLN